MSGEQQLMPQVMLALSEAGCLVWRNNVGAFLDPRTDRWVRYGVCNPGGSDLIGVAPDGRFLAVEVKGKRTAVRPEQETFIAAVLAAGGRAGIVRSVSDALALLR